MMHAWITAAVVLASTATALALTKLTPQQIQESFFNGVEFTSSTPSNIKFKMMFTGDGKVTREPVRNLEAVEGGLLHQLEGQQADLLYAGECRG
jgi:hypothetical protein